MKVSDYKRTKNIIVSCFYCEPSRNKNNYLDHVEEVLETNGGGLQVACGDFNIDMLNENQAARVSLEYLMYSQGLDLVSLREPTRETATSGTCIDSIYSNISVLRSQIEKTTFSDHYSLNLDFDIHHEVVEEIFEFISFKKLEDPLYCEKFLFFLSHSLGKIPEQDLKAEIYLENIAKALKEATERYFPLKQIKRRDANKLWITNRIKRHIVIRDKIYQLWIRTKSPEIFNKYKEKRNEINKEIRAAKRNEVQNKVDQNNPKELYRYIKRSRGGETQVKKSSELTVDHFNDYFITACDPENNTPVTNNWTSQRGYQSQSMYFFPVTNDEIYNFIVKLKNKKSVGFDGVNVRILKMTTHIVTSYLKTAFNKCISEGVFPSSMKIAMVLSQFLKAEKRM